MSFLNISEDTLRTAMVSTAVFCGVVALGYLVRGILLRRLAIWAEKTASSIDDIVIASIKVPSVIWMAMLGIYAALQFSTIADRQLVIIEKVLLGAGLLSVTLALSTLVSEMIKHHAARLDGSGSSTSLIQNIARIVVWATGAMVILSSLGVSVAPILATLGVGGLAVALALQDTLANLFAGVHISVNKLVRIGDYVKLESGDEGYVTDINWRTTAIRMPSNNMVLVPNSKLTQSIITNYYYPSKDMAFVVPVGVHYGSDLRKVERVTCEVAREVMQQVPGGVPETSPCIRYHTLGDFSVQFNVVLRVKEYTDQHLLKHEFIMRLQDRYAKEGIVIPYPVQAINTAQEGATGRM
jgi:small-conductance mechanosensitive channel